MKDPRDGSNTKQTLHLDNKRDRISKQRYSKYGMNSYNNINCPSKWREPTSKPKKYSSGR